MTIGLWSGRVKDDGGQSKRQGTLTTTTSTSLGPAARMTVTKPCGFPTWHAQRTDFDERGAIRGISSEASALRAEVPTLKFVQLFCRAPEACVRNSRGERLLPKDAVCHRLAHCNSDVGATRMNIAKAAVKKTIERMVRSNPGPESCRRDKHEFASCAIHFPFLAPESATPSLLAQLAFGTTSSTRHPEESYCAAVVENQIRT